ncbi:Hypothetical predicted protein [Cloeon dipterum]|uniref:Uncharacterized protein n=1 Tax=Cloeon dipterum TaxID=197152 RepID=A0A8S1D8L9_9INSE|nr:Hypothetical predicted protein [Cloeon dipterum]
MNENNCETEFPRLPEIKFATIAFGGKSANVLRCFIERNGESLQELYLEGINIEEKMIFGEIFSSCPNLQQRIRATPFFARCWRRGTAARQEERVAVVFSPSLALYVCFSPSALATKIIILKSANQHN